MNKTIKQNLVIIQDVRLTDVFKMLLDWMESGRDIQVKDPKLKGWILFGSSLIRYDHEQKKLLLAFKTRENHPEQMINFTVSRVDRFILKRFSGSQREYHEQGYRLGIQTGYENYLVNEWTLPRVESELATLIRDEVQA